METQMTERQKPRETLSFDKVDRALELEVIDWLQWSPDLDENKAQLALTIIAKRKLAYAEAIEERDDIKTRYEKLISNATKQKGPQRLFLAPHPDGDGWSYSGNWMKVVDAESYYEISVERDRLVRERDEALQMCAKLAAALEKNKIEWETTQPEYFRILVAWQMARDYLDQYHAWSEGRGS